MMQSTALVVQSTKWSKPRLLQRPLFFHTKKMDDCTGKKHPREIGTKRDMDVSENNGFSPQIIYFYRIFHHKPSILGYHHFRKHLYIISPPKKKMVGKLENVCVFLRLQIWAVIEIPGKGIDIIDQLQIPQNVPDTFFRLQRYHHQTFQVPSKWRY